MRFLACALMLTFCVVSAAGAASKTCYRKSEAAAEQAIRYTTEVMVMSDTCRYETYDRFALRNRDALVGYQETLKQHFQREGGGAQSKLDRYMTHLANEAALRTGNQDIGQVCAVAVQFLATADTLGGDEFKRYIEQQVAQHGGDYKFCKE
jgi:hypothetical protein